MGSTSKELVKARWMLVVLLALAVTLATLPALAVAQETPDQEPVNQTGRPVRIDQIRPIPPGEMVKGIEKVGDNVVKVGQGAAAQVVPFLIIAAAMLIVIGAAIAPITKSVLKAGVGILVGAAILYIANLARSADLAVVAADYGRHATSCKLKSEAKERGASMVTVPARTASRVRRAVQKHFMPKQGLVVR